MSEPLWMINRNIESILEGSVNPETGEIEFNDDLLLQLTETRNEKIESIACYIKSELAEIDAFKAEEKNLAARRKAKENKVEHWKTYLAQNMEEGEKISTAKCEIKWAKSSRIEVTEKFVAWAKRKAKDLLKYSDPVPDKTAIKAALKAGGNVKYAEIINVQNIQIK